MLSLPLTTKSTPLLSQYVEIHPDWTSTTYTGVTTIISSVLYPDKYSGVDPEVLSRAAARGTRIHELCQATDTRHTEPRPEDAQYKAEVDNYLQLKADHAITMIANEYLVSNPDWQVASQIDCIDSQLNLYDIKTTYSLDVESVSWQLSFYAYMFERQNPDLKAGDLYAVWLRGDRCELVEVPRKRPEQVEQVVEAYKEGRTLTEPTEDLTELITIEQELADIKEIQKSLEAHREELLAPVEERMNADGVKTIESDRIKITLVADSVTRRFDSKRFSTDHADLYEQYTTETTRKGYIKTTLK